MNRCNEKYIHTVEEKLGIVCENKLFEMLKQPRIKLVGYKLMRFNSQHLVTRYSFIGSLRFNYNRRHYFNLIFSMLIFFMHPVTADTCYNYLFYFVFPKKQYKHRSNTYIHIHTYTHTHTYIHTYNSTKSTLLIEHQNF